MNPLEPLPSPGPTPSRPQQLALPRTPGRSPAAGRIPPSGRRPAGSLAGPPAPLEASFRFEKAARQVVVTLTRPETREVVRQIPPARIVKLIAYLRELTERIFDQRA